MASSFFGNTSRAMATTASVHHQCNLVLASYFGNYMKYSFIISARKEEARVKFMMTPAESHRYPQKAIVMHSVSAELLQTLWHNSPAALQPTTSRFREPAILLEVDFASAAIQHKKNVQDARHPQVYF
mmetsp:Transcript_3923/g.5833  ORF Transcript_3923/g.5833 Transcript_3923/m.5833 type:complete len:128 (-) Transcript_3923:32-415(-)